MRADAADVGRDTDHQRRSDRAGYGAAKAGRGVNRRGRVKVPFSHGTAPRSSHHSGGIETGTADALIPAARPARTAPRLRGPMHDAIYKQLYADPRMIEDVLRGFFPGSWIGKLDFATLRRLPASGVSDRLDIRRGDMLWQVDLRRGGRLYLLLLLEFQSSVDHCMALRVHVYTGLAYQNLVRSGRAGPRCQLPDVLPLVIYNGDRPWNAATAIEKLIGKALPELAEHQPRQRFLLLDEAEEAKRPLPRGNLAAAGIELRHGREPGSVERALKVLAGLAEGSPARQAVTTWFRHAMAKAGVPEEEAARIELKESAMDFAKRLEGWKEGWRLEGLEQGRTEGLEQGRTERTTLVIRQVERKFGATTAEQLSGLLDGSPDPERLVRVADWIIDCDTGEELIGRASASESAEYPPSCP